MERLIERIKGNATLMASVKNCETEIEPILQKFITNFPEFTDHSLAHSKRILNYAAHLLRGELVKLNDDEVYILIMAGYLHDIGMCPTNKMKKEILESSPYNESKKSFEDYLRMIHHELSYQYITTHWKKLKIVSETYAEAIALVGMGHRIVDLFDFNKYEPDFPVKSGSEYISLPYLAGILRLADELDITNDRTPELLYNEYFPNNMVSKQEWAKHKANYLVNFKNDTIKIRSKCHTKELYFAVLKQYNKIESILNYIQKLIRIIPQNERELQFSFSKLEKDVKTFGFLPKEIGFSFDLQNTIDAFIGDNLYENKYVAIRECLQNAIDTCRYRKRIDKSQYEPKIDIVLSGKQLIISDNGLGMDEFIVENYFAKLAKSYYQEPRVLNEFEAISQFGVGVFSYFLICDYFEVESKFKGKETIKFRVNKDAEGYFHFYDKTTKAAEGTSITFFLKEEMKFEELIQQVKEYIRFVEIPINVYHQERHEIIHSQKFNLDKVRDLKIKITHPYFKSLENLEIIDSNISTYDYEGAVGLIVNKDKQGTYDPSSLFDLYRYLKKGQIQLSHKGIYVGDIDDKTFEGVIGKLNIKRKTDIEIGRYRIKNSEYLNSIVSDFHLKNLEKLFSNWKKNRKKTKQELSRKFIEHCLAYRFDIMDERVLKLIEENLYFTIYNFSKKEYLTFKELNLMEEVIIINDNRPFTRSNRYQFEDIDEIYNYLRKPLLLENIDSIANKIKFLFQLFRKPIEIISTENHWHLLIKCNQTKSYLRKNIIQGYRFEGYNFDKPYIASFPHLDIDSPFNLKHEIIGSFVSNSEKISKNQELYDLSIEFLSLLEAFMFKFHVGGIEKPTESISIMNEILESINKILGTHFTLVSSDFPNWINKKIEWEKTTSK